MKVGDSHHAPVTSDLWYYHISDIFILPYVVSERAWGLEGAPLFLPWLPQTKVTSYNLVNIVALPGA